ncbi:hypothetical protein Bca52824_005391 [Brassica carinata]|uniref:GIL1/IRKI C-terminal domain-containing protein n=1 Tax=Brassica carinata TaxID=52824 RepID=A0A8X7WQS0_BRACI|nr:hypothetical protein Bca52824_005391 [Brassica carinata]
MGRFFVRVRLITLGLDIFVPPYKTHSDILRSGQIMGRVLFGFDPFGYFTFGSDNGSGFVRVRLITLGLDIFVPPYKTHSDILLGEFSEKLQYLESYCDGLKKALVSREKNSKMMPVSEDVMVEGFLQIVSESRLSIKQFLKTLVTEIDEEDSNLISNINALLQPHNLSFTSKYSKTIQYHLEAIISQSVHQDFENCVFQKNGKPKLLDQEQDRQAKFSYFASLRNLSWNEMLKKGTKYYSEEFSSFCDEKMSLIITTLKWTRPWSEEMLQAFFVAAKCVWLLHLLAFSFKPALGILRVEENREFETSYMEDMGADRDRQRSLASRGPAWVKVMVMPGFYVQDRVLRCKVLCRYKSLA